MKPSPRVPRLVKGTRFTFRRALYVVFLFLAGNFVFTWHIFWFDVNSAADDTLPTQSGGWLPRRQWQRATRKVASFLDSTARAVPSGKGWLALTNGRPWMVAYETGCEAYFGNGFFQRFTFSGLLAEKPVNPRMLVLPGEGPQSGDEVPGWFLCRQNKVLQTSICEGGRIAMHVSRLQMSRGGEPIGSVIGRTDEEELPSFEPGAFEVVTGAGGWGASPHNLASDFVVEAIMPRGSIQIHALANLLRSMLVVPSAKCTQVVREPTLFVSRYEYANLFHTTTDWYSAYITSRVTGFDAPLPVVFIDGHAQSPLDDCWRALFGNITHGKHLEGTVCYDHAIFVPIGYNTVIFEGVNTGGGGYCKGCAPGHESDDVPQENAATSFHGRGLAESQMMTARLREFGEVLSKAWGGDHRPWSWAKWRQGEMGGPLGKPLEPGERDLHVLFVRREDYLAHPRHSGQVEKRLDNEDEVLVALRFWAAEWAGVGDYNDLEKSVEADRKAGRAGRGRVVIENGRLAHMTYEEQMQAVHRAAVILGAHGAGMTHLVSARSGTEVVEIVTPLFQRPHFERLTVWRGDVGYTAITCTSQSANPEEVVTAIREIATRLLGGPPRLRAKTG